MVWLNILNNENLILAAEVLIIVVGSMLLGILLSYLNSGGLKTKFADVTLALEEEKKQAEELREQVRQISQIRAELQHSVDELKIKSAEQARTIYDQKHYLQLREEEFKNQKAAVDGLHATIDSYQHRIDIIQQELEKQKTPTTRPKKESVSMPKARANFEHVSKLLGKQVTENDLTLIAGIGPKTAALLQTHGIHTWEELAAFSVDDLRKILTDAGGIYKTQDPSHWAKQAIMASTGEWRKLRVYQETLRKQA
jgi:predicted flap endonuclease-1-like 5' DNA nuclease